jgi:DNA-binding transcriptional regulator YhcF (GntR family)
MENQIKKELLAHRMRQLVQDAIGLGMKADQIQDLFWKAYSSESGIVYNELSPEELAEAWSR